MIIDWRGQKKKKTEKVRANVKEQCEVSGSQFSFFDLKNHAKILMQYSIKFIKFP